MGINICCKAVNISRDMILNQMLENNGQNDKVKTRKKNNVEDSQGIFTNGSFNKPKPSIKCKAGSTIKLPIQFKSKNCDQIITSQDQSPEIVKSKTGACKPKKLDNKDKEETKIYTSRTLTIEPSISAMMKVAPCHFRVEKPGKFTDKYETMELIGIGGYGVVKKARNMKTNEVRAVKVIAKDKCQTTSVFSDEIVAMTATQI